MTLRGLALLLAAGMAFLEAGRAESAAGFEMLVDGHLAGSGFFVSADGLGFTAEHVLGPGAGRKRLEILHPALGRIGASLVAIDAGHDLALVRAELPKGRKAQAVTPRDESLAVGDPLRLLGTPVFRHQVWVPGTVARREPAFEWIGSQQRYLEVFYVAAMTPRGMSGGMWLDREGRVAGLQSGMIVVNEALQGVAFVVPAPAMSRLLEERKSARTPWLGLAGDELWESRERVREFPEGAEGVVVTVLVEDGPATRAGIDKGWLITAAGGRKVRYRDDLLSAARALEPGDTLELGLLRPGDPEPFEKGIELGCIEDRRK